MKDNINNDDTNNRMAELLVELVEQYGVAEDVLLILLEKYGLPEIPMEQDFLEKSTI